MKSGDTVEIFKNAYKGKASGSDGLATLVEPIGAHCIKGVRLECWKIHFPAAPKDEFVHRWLRAKS